MKRFYVFDVEAMREGTTIKPTTYQSIDKGWSSFFLSQDGRSLCVLSQEQSQKLWPQYFDLTRKKDSSPSVFLEPEMAMKLRMENRDTSNYVQYESHSHNHRWILTQNTDLLDKTKKKWLLWDFTHVAGKRLFNYSILGENKSVAFLGDSTGLVAANEGKIRLFNLPKDGDPSALDKNPVQELDFPATGIAVAALSSDGKRLAVMDLEFSTWVWNLKSGRQQKPIILPPCKDISFAPREMVWRADGNAIFVIGSLKGSVSQAEAGATPKSNVLWVFHLMTADVFATAKEAVGRNLAKADWAALNLVDFESLGQAKYRETFDGLLTPEPLPVAAPVPFIPLKGKGKPGLLHDSDPKKTGELKLGSKKYGQKPDEKYADKYPMEFEAGKTYLLEMRSVLLDSYLILLGPDGKEVSRDDDSGGGRDARIIYPCETAGTYTVIATTCLPNQTGKYELTKETLNVLAAEEPIALGNGIAEWKDKTITTIDYKLLDGPGKIFAVTLPKKLCQIDMSSANFSGLLWLENSQGKILATANAVGTGKARILFNNPEPGATYRIMVIAAIGTLPGTFTLTVRDQ